MSKETYCKLSSNWLKQMIELDGENDVKYRYSKKMKTDGRMYVDGKFGVPACKKNLRGFLCSPFYLDYDMKNAHPSILRYILKTFYDCDFEKDYPAFNHYLLDRNGFLSESELSKKQVLIYLNGDEKVKYQGNNIAAGMICSEFKCIQKRIYNLPEPLQVHGHYKKYDTGKNYQAKFMNKLLVIFENKILQDVVDYFKDEGKEVSSLIYDGLHLSKQYDNQLEKLNEISKEYGVVWDVKEFDKSLEQCPQYQNYNPEHGLPPAYENKTYENIKQKLEETCFYLLQPSLYCIEEEGEYNLYKSADFQSRIAHHKIVSYAKGYEEKTRIFSKWAEDPDKRTFYRLGFEPNLDACPANVYNTFKGFAYSDYDSVDYEPKLDVIDIFKYHISRLVNHEEHVVEYFINYFAHLFQKPYEIPGVCLVLKSREGLGKDLLTGLIIKLMGKDLGYKTANINHLMGGFNGPVKNKLLIQLNEMSGKDGFAYNDEIKDLITAEEITINQKGEKKYIQKHYSRYIFCSNNLTPLEIKKDSRRFVVVSAQPVVPKKEEFSSFIDILSDSDSLYTLANYLHEKDISDFDAFKDAPVTAIAKEMAKANTSPVYLFLDDILENDKYKKLFEGEYKTKDGFECFNVGEFKNQYKIFCIENDLQFLNIPTKVYYALLSEIGISKAKMMIDGEQSWRLIINVEKVTEALQGLVVRD
ncbi:MAG: DUF5906 domain-containing protein [Promethearchaeota archaeon]|jgi:hypothetical protein